MIALTASNVLVKQAFSMHLYQRNNGRSLRMYVYCGLFSLPFNLPIFTGCQVPLASCRGRLEGGSRETEVGNHGCRTKMNGSTLDFLI